MIQHFVGSYRMEVKPMFKHDEIPLARKAMLSNLGMFLSGTVSRTVR